jgi:hypothetical protein
MAKKKAQNEITIRSSAAEYLTYIAATGDNPQSIEMRYEDENIWLTQKMMAVLYDVDKRTVSYHINKIYEDNELQEKATVRKYWTVQIEGERQVEREQDHYNLQMIIAVGFKVNNERAVQFRKWANRIVKDYTIQGWVMDEERLKHGGTIITEDYFEKQLEKIREIRLSERRFYQKITDIYSTALDWKAGFIPRQYNKFPLQRRYPDRSAAGFVIMIKRQKPPETFLPKCRTNCISPFMVILPPNLSITARTQKSNIWA